MRPLYTVIITVTKINPLFIPVSTCRNEIPKRMCLLKSIVDSLQNIVKEC